MWGIVVSALGRVFGWFLGAGTIKWAVAALLVYGISAIFDVLLSLLPTWFSSAGLTAGTSAITPEVWYFIDYFKLEYGISIALSAYCARFLIRRIPFIG